MTREEKVLKRKARAKARAEKHNEKFRLQVAKARNNDFPFSVPLNAIRNNSSWYDSRSETGYSQVCEMGGTCESPCNGDC